jgi:hypothetical protein
MCRECCVFSTKCLSGLNACSLLDHGCPSRIIMVPLSRAELSCKYFQSLSIGYKDDIFAGSQPQR